MKKSILYIMVSLLLIVPGVAGAYSWTGIYNPTPNIYIQHDGNWIDEYNVSLTDFNPLTDTVTSAYADVYVYDDSDSSYEYCRINFTTSNVDGFTWEVGGSSGSPEMRTIQLISGYTGFNGDGATPFTLYATSGDFYFDKIEYHAEGTRVPEPATLLFLGSGLVGLGFFSRRKFKK